MRRKILSVMLTICMVLALMPQMVFAADTYITDDGQFEYTISGENVKIVSFIGNETIVTIPSEIKGCHVISINSNAFDFNTKITSVTFQSPSYVTSIGERAFTTCSNLTSITLPDSVTTMGERAFFRCESLASVVIPGSVKSIKEHTFAGCKGLTSVTIPDSVTLIEKGAFYGCTNLERIKFEENSQLTYIDINAFRDCTSLKRVIIPQGVERIKAQAFCNCTELESVEIPNSISSIGYGTFNDCTSLESVFLPDGLDVTNAEIPDATPQVRYSLDTERGEVTITGIELGTGKTGVAIPATICGYPVVAVVESEQSKVGAHTCNPREVIKSNALKTAGTCQSEAVYYYSCGICGKVYSGGNTFNGEKDSNNHTGTKKWIQNEKQHKQYWNCCDAVVVDYVDHNWNSGVCSVCDYVCMHTGGEATCKSKATCEYCGEEYGELDSSKHKLANTSAKAPTYYEAGHKEYWQCKDCEKCFSDEAGKTEIADIDAWKAGPGRIDRLIPPKTDSVTSDRDGNVSVSIEKSIVTTDGKTEASITDAVAESILDKLASSESKSVVINASAGSISLKPAASGTSTEISISGAALKKLSEVEGIRITFVTDNGKIVLDGQALAAASKSADEDGKVTFLIETVERTGSILKLELKLKASSGDVTDFGGGIAAVTVAISDELKDRNPVCVYIDAQDIYHMIGGTLNDDGTFTFVTGHFSTYAIMPEEKAAAVIKEQTADAQKAAIKKVKSTVTLSTKKVKKGIKVTVKVPASQKAYKTGVIIYRSQKKSSGYVEYKRVKTSGSSYTVTNTKNLKGKRLIKGKKYYYKARAYKVIDGKTYCGPMSSIKYAKAR